MVSSSMYLIPSVRTFVISHFWVPIQTHLLPTLISILFKTHVLIPRFRNFFIHTRKTIPHPAELLVNFFVCFWSFSMYRIPNPILTFYRSQLFKSVLSVLLLILDSIFFFFFSLSEENHPMTLLEVYSSLHF